MNAKPAAMSPAAAVEALTEEVPRPVALSIKELL